MGSFILPSLFKLVIISLSHIGEDVESLNLSKIAAGRSKDVEIEM
jgi:hypothetical protein